MQVKNISGKTISCVNINFGVLEGINDRLQPQMSWPWGWSVSNGGCSRETAGKFDIKKGREVELNSADILVFYKKNNSKISEISFHQAEFITATIFFRGERQKKGFPGHDSSMKIGPTVKYSEYQDN